MKLVDFGIAKVETAGGVNGSPSAAQPTMIMTPGYASPEQIAGDASGKSGDIYSVAVVLYQLLTGRLPYVDERGRPNLAAQLSGALPDPPSHELAKKQTPRTAEIAALSLARPRSRGPDRAAARPAAALCGPCSSSAKTCAAVSTAVRSPRIRPASSTTICKLVARNKVAAAIVALVVLGAVGDLAGRRQSAPNAWRSRRRRQSSSDSSRCSTAKVGALAAGRPGRAGR